MMNDPGRNPVNTVCPLCRYAEHGQDEWPCRSCKRIHEMKDHFEPNDDTPAASGGLPEDRSADLAKRLMEKFSVTCANCPATIVCMARYADQPDVRSENCVDAFAFWLKQEAAHG